MDVVVDSIVVSVTTVVVVVVVIVDSLESEVSARETEELELTTNAAPMKPAIIKVVDFVITLTTYTELQREKATLTPLVL